MKIKQGERQIEVKAEVPRSLKQVKSQPEDMSDLDRLDVTRWQRDQRARAMVYQRRISNGNNAA
jgi:hypothetical protein